MWQCVLWKSLLAGHYKAPHISFRVVIWILLPNAIWWWLFLSGQNPNRETDNAVNSLLLATTTSLRSTCVLFPQVVLQILKQKGDFQPQLSPIRKDYPATSHRTALLGELELTCSDEVFAVFWGALATARMKWMRWRELHRSLNLETSPPLSSTFEHICAHLSTHISSAEQHIEPHKCECQFFAIPPLSTYLICVKWDARKLIFSFFCIC